MSGNPLAQITPTLQGVPALVDPLSHENARPAGGRPSSSSGDSRHPDASRHVVARTIDEAPEELLRLLQKTLDEAARKAREGASLVELERALAEQLLVFAQRCLAFLCAEACRAAMLADLSARGLMPKDMRLRTDEAGYATVNTTYGTITFPTFAYRDLTTSGASVTRHPAQSEQTESRDAHCSR